MVMPVLSIGETLIDLIVNDGAPSLEMAEGFVARDGGAPANVAVALARLGIMSAFAGVVGDDPFGRRLRDMLSREGVDTSRLRMSNEAPTSLAFAWKDEQGDGHFQLLRLADRLLAEHDVDGFGIPDLASIVVGSVALAAEPSRQAVTHAVELAAISGVPVIFDVNLRPSLWDDLESARTACRPIIERSRLLKLSLDDARHLFGVECDPASAFTVARRSAPGMVVLTDGARGAWFMDEHEQLRHVPAFEIEPVEPTGAGDAFTAALISRLIARDWTMPEESDVCFASAAGALATTKHGAMDGLPTAAHMEAFLAKRGD
jgi:fructokinase